MKTKSVARGIFSTKTCVGIVMAAMAGLCIAGYFFYRSGRENDLRTILGLAVIAAKADQQVRSEATEAPPNQDVLMIAFANVVEATPSSVVADFRTQSETIGDHLDYILDIGSRLRAARFNDVGTVDLGGDGEHDGEPQAGRP